MNILIAANDRLIIAVQVFLISLYTNNENCKVYFLYHQFSQKNRKKVNKIAKQFHQKVEYLYVDVKIFKEAPVAEHLGFEAYFRLLAADLLPDDVKRVLYLDVDIIADKSLKNLYRQDMKDIFVCACEDPALKHINDCCKDAESIERRKILKNKIFENLKFTENDKYFNSGVMLMNIERMKAEGYTKEFFGRYIRKYKEKIICHDQDILNAVFHNQVRWIPYKYNYRTYLYNSRTAEEMEREIAREAVIIHYVEKPWKKPDCIGGRLFWSYAAKGGLGGWYWFILLQKAAEKIYQNTILPVKRAVRG